MEIIITLPNPHNGQWQIIHEAKRFNVLSCGRRFGKTMLGLNRCATPETLSYPMAWFAPTYKDMLEIWREAARVFKPIISRSSISERRMEFITGGLLEFWSLDNADAGRGRKYKRVVIDEAAMAPYLQEAWEQSIRPTLADYQGDAWFLSTPKGRNFFWQIWTRGLDPENGEWQSWSKPTLDNPYIQPSEIEAARLDLPDLVFRQEYLAEFLQGEGVVFRNLAACMHASLSPSLSDHPRHRIVAGVDWGKQNDFTVISIGCADCRVELARDRFNQIDYTFQRGRLYALLDAWDVKAVLPERNSIGEPIIEQMLRDGVPIIEGPDEKPGFMTTATTKPPLIENLALAFERVEWQFQPDPLWLSELEAYERVISPITGRSQYNAPEGLHDDTVIARALMVWASGRVYHLPMPTAAPSRWQKQMLSEPALDGGSKWKRF